MRPQIHRVVEFLKDGKWHTIQEISRETRVHEFKIQIIASFLADYSFLSFREKEQEAKLSEVFVEFLEKTQIPESYTDMSASRLW